MATKKFQEFIDYESDDKFLFANALVGDLTEQHNDKNE